MKHIKTKMSKTSIERPKADSRTTIVGSVQRTSVLEFPDSDATQNMKVKNISAAESKDGLDTLYARGGCNSKLC